MRTYERCWKKYWTRWNLRLHNLEENLRNLILDEMHFPQNKGFLVFACQRNHSFSYPFAQISKVLSELLQNALEDLFVTDIKKLQ